MFRQTFMVMFLALMLAGTGALAQTEPEGPPPSSPGESMPSAQMSPSGSMEKRHANHALIASCRSNASAQGLTGHSRREAVLSCVRAQRPGLAIRMVCRHEGKKMGLSHQSLRAFVKKCKASHRN
jgi:hypothetical protein